MQAAVPSKPNKRVRELSRDPDQLTCAVGNVLICFSARTPVQSYLDGSVQAIYRYAKDYPSGLGLLVLISVDEPPPDELGRRAILATREALKSCVRGSVLVVEGEGFAASAKRSVIAMFTLASSLPFPTKVAGTIADGSVKLANMLGPRLAPDLDGQSIADVAVKVRRTFK